MLLRTWQSKTHPSSLHGAAQFHASPGGFPTTEPGWLPGLPQSEFGTRAGVRMLPNLSSKGTAWQQLQRLAEIC